jgi:hypothetical protein
MEDKMQVLSRLEQKWAPTGLLDGTAMKQHPYEKRNMALLLENQNKQILVEEQTTNKGGANFTPGAGEQWAGIVLPMVRKVFAEISAKEFLSTQPMSMPYGLVFYLDFQYNNQQPAITGTGTAGSRFNLGGSVYGTTNTPGVDPFGGLYGAGRFGFSINEYVATIPSQSMTVATASYGDVNYNANVSASVAVNGFRKVTIASASTLLANLDTTAVRSFVFTGSLGQISEATIYPEFTSYNSTFDQIILLVSGSLLTSGSSTVPTGSVTAYYSVQTTGNFRGDYEDTPNSPLTGSNSIPEIDIAPSSTSITAKTRKLKYSYTQEAQQDYNAFQSIDIEAEATSLLSEYISREIDLELIDMIDLAAVQTVEVWSAVNNTYFNPNTNSWYQASATNGGYYNSQQDWFQTLGTKMQKVSRAIHAKTQRGEANVAMVSPKVAAIIESIAGYAAGTDGSKMEYAFGGKESGKLNGKFKILVNSYMQENAIIMGFKGANYLDSGGVFAPYIPLISTPLVYDPKTFALSKGLMTRYAKLILRPEFFGKILVADFNTF